jgi:hypothetical protein
VDEIPSEEDELQGSDDKKKATGEEPESTVDIE